MATAETPRRSRRTRRRAAAAATGIAALAAVVHVSTQQSAAAAPPAAAAADVVDVVPAERGELCSLRADKIRLLRAALPEASSPESLRDATWLLEEKVEVWRSGAEGVPAATVPVRLASEVEAAWREALQSHDAGNAAGTRAALARADARLAALDKQLAATAIPGCR